MRSAILLAVLSLAACGSADGESASGSGKVQRSYDVASFDKIDLAGSPEVIVRTGAKVSVRAEGDAEILDRLEIDVEGDTLRIGHKKSSWSFGFKPSRRIIVHVTTPSLSSASVGGSGNIDIDKVEGEAFAGSVSGSGNIGVAALRVDKALFSIAGSGGINAAGTAGSVKMDIAGSGNLHLSDLDSRVASVSIAGSGNVHARASETADVSMLGSGNVTLAGTAKCSVNKAGSGNVRCGG